MLIILYVGYVQQYMEVNKVTPNCVTKLCEYNYGTLFVRNSEPVIGYWVPLKMI